MKVSTLNFDTGLVLDMSSMFSGATNFNSVLTFSDTTNVETMAYMFFNASAFNKNIGYFTTPFCENMSNMFNGATAFDRNIGTWDIQSITDFTDFMASKTDLTFSRANLDAIYNSWSALFVQPNINISFGSATYNIAFDLDKQILLSPPNNWIITDGGGF